MFLTYKNALKCRAILDARDVNDSDPQRPPKFRLPAPEEIRRWMGDAKRKKILGGGGNSGGGGGYSWLSLTYRMPIGAFTPPPGGGGSFWWRGVRAGGTPFGWSYSPAICHPLVMAVIWRVLARRGIRGWVYLDAILLYAKRRVGLRRAVKECITRLWRAGFIVGEKSETAPTERISFIGKSLDTRAGTIGNAVGALVGAFCAWVRGVGRGKLPKAAMERLLGKLCWLGRPNAGLGAFLAGADATLQQGMGRFGRGVAKGIATVLLFSCIPQAADPLGDNDGETWEMFTDAAPEDSGY